MVILGVLKLTGAREWRLINFGGLEIKPNAGQMISIVFLERHLVDTYLTTASIWCVNYLFGTMDVVALPITLQKYSKI